nr:hypothetical protein [Pseudomonas juntendi]
MAKLKGRSKKKSPVDEIRGIELSIAEMKARINAYRVFRADSIEIVMRPSEDKKIREFVGPLIGKRSAGIYIQRVVAKKKKGPKKLAPQVKAEKESA